MNRNPTISELAFELGVKPYAILAFLPAIGITERKTHSSRIAAETADQVRRFKKLLIHYRGRKPAA